MRKTLSIILFLLALTLGACRGGEEQAFEVRPTPISAPAAEGGGAADIGGGVGQPITLRLWTHRNDAFNAAYQTLADAYTAVNPDITVVIETFDAAAYEPTVQNALASGTAGDILQLPGASVCGHSASLAPAPEAISGSQNAFAPAALAGFVCDGVLYGLPQESATAWGLAVNNAGLAPGAAWDFARFVALDAANAAQWNGATGTPPALQ